MIDIKKTLDILGIKEMNNGTSIGSVSFGGGRVVKSVSPVDGNVIGGVTETTEEEYEKVMQSATSAFKEWRLKPAPLRGEIVRQYGEKLRKYKQPLGELVSYEMGKSLQEGLGEVQEMIDICDFAVGLSRQLHGLTMHSERPGHRMYEQYHPLGVVGIISAFNFPVAVWNWNTALAWVCGDTCVWKASEKSPLCSVACQNIWNKVAKENDLPDGISCIVNGNYKVGEMMTSDDRLPLISATGSTRMGRIVGSEVAKRFGTSLLELGGNNAIIIMEDADLDMVIRGTLFGAVGTAGQRCTSTRRLLCHESVVDEVTNGLLQAYKQVSIGNPLEDSTLMGPLINEGAVENMRSSIEQAKAEGCEILCGGIEGIERMADRDGHYVEPTIVRVPKGTMPEVVKEETFAPILYIFTISDLDEALAMHNDVDQGLSSAIFTNSMRNAGRFLSPEGSDCGIANINIGTSGAEIGGAFGGEKDTGGGRESGSDSWKAYMRRQTCTTNWSDEMPLAQGIEFG